MTALSTDTGCGCGGCTGTHGVDPFTSLQAHYGMLIGVADLDVLAGYARDKSRLRGAWWLGEGVVWGYGVSAYVERGELQVEPGLALDRRGREVPLDTVLCVDVGAWYVAQTAAGAALPPVGDTETDVVADVVATFRSCASRPVPVMAAPCDDQSATTACTRLVESVELELRATSGPAPAAPPGRVVASWYPRLASLLGFGVAPGAAEPDVDEARHRISSDGDPATVSRELERMLALDVVELGPAAPADDLSPVAYPYPAADPVPVHLARVTMRLRRTDDGSIEFLGADVDLSSRVNHIATTALAALVLGQTTVSGRGIAPDPAVRLRVEADSLRYDPAATGGPVITFRVSRTIEPSTLAAAVSLTVLAGTGWNPVTVQSLTVTVDAVAGGALVVTAALAGPIEAGYRQIRLVVSGTGPAPLLDAELRPLLGTTTQPFLSPADGADAVLVLSPGDA